MHIIEKIVQNIGFVINGGFRLALTFLTIVGTYFTLINPDKTDIGMECRLTLLCMSVILAYVCYLIWVGICKKVTVYEEDNKKLVVQYGDLIKIIDNYEKSSEKAIFVIPVNRCFDTIVDDIIVEKQTVHGQFIKYVTDNLWTLEEVDKKNDSSLRDVIPEVLDVAVKDKGKNKRYPVGALAKLESVKGNVFYLLALPKFKKVGEKVVVDESINMHDYLECLQRLVDYYKVDGRNLPIYIPTIGCGLSRLYISVDNSIRQILSIWRLNHDVIRNSINIVVYEKLFWNVHILKYRREGK